MHFRYFFYRHSASGGPPRTGGYDKAIENVAKI
jgi:hypothetical protein